MASLWTRILPREKSFFEMFTEVTTNIKEGAQALVDLLEDYSNLEAKVSHIKDLEHRGDQMTHDIMTRLNQTFLTPLDREDIHELCSKLDDVIDLIDAFASRLVIYDVRAPRPGALELARNLLKATGEIHACVSMLEKHDHLLPHCIEINRLENEGDATVRAAIARLFEEEKDPVQIIKWKELYEALEIATDRCEDVANVIESVVLKSA